MDVQRDRAMVKQLRSRYLWARDKLYCRRDEEWHSGREWELGRVKTFGGGPYRREMVSHDAARHVCAAVRSVPARTRFYKLGANRALMRGLETGERCISMVYDEENLGRAGRERR